MNGKMRIFAWALAILGQKASAGILETVRTALLPERQLHSGKPPIRIFVLAGQSNTVGHGEISAIDLPSGEQKNATLEWLVTNVPERFGMLKEEKETETVDEFTGRTRRLRKGTKPKNNEELIDNKKVTWKVRQDVVIACNSRDFDDLSPAVADIGKMYAGFCAGDPGQEGRQFGPELGFGWTVGDALQDGLSADETKVLLLKIAWGGKSLAVDFRPPSSGGDIGPFYQSMIANIKMALAYFKNIFPGEHGRGFELSGFVWNQGWNDGCDEVMANEYESNLANLIRDVRNDLKAPDLPFAIASTGMAGYSPQPNRREKVFNAEMNIAMYPEFQENVMSIDTRPFAREVAPASPTNFTYHWNSNAESYWLIGQSLGEAMINLVKI